MEEQTGIRKEYGNLSFQFDEENPYEELDTTSGAKYEGDKTTHYNSQNSKDGETEIKAIQEENTSILNLKRLLAIILIIILVAGFATMSSLFYVEKSTSNEKTDNKAFEQQIPASMIKAKQSLGSSGYTFLVSFIQSHHSVNSSNRTILVSSENDFSITVTLSEKLSPSLISISNKRAGNVTMKKINVHYSLVPTYFAKEYKAIYITTSSASSVLSISDLEFSSASTTVLPVDKLSTYYIISTATPSNMYYGTGSHFTIASTTDNTHINITLVIDRDINISLDGRNYGNGDQITIILSRFQTFQVGLDADLSGTTINTSHSVAVFAGNKCIKLGDYGACSMLMEMVPPIDKLDSIFIVPPNINRYKSQVRIISPTETEVKYSTEGNKTSAFLPRNQKTDFIVYENETVTIESVEPLLVNSFAYGSAQYAIYGDPYMITIPGIHQYINEYNLIVPDNFNFSFVTFMLKTDSLQYLRINETSIHENKTCYFSTILVDKSFYSVWTLSIPSGVTKLKTKDGTPFGVIIYGQRDNDGHGYTGNAIYSSCKEGWIHLENSCYFISPKRVTFEVALDACEDESASLTEHQNVKIEKVVGLQLSAQGDVGIWIAVTDINQEGVYAYVSNGSRVINDNWAKGQPRGGKHYNCAVARKDDSWKWYDYPCKYTFYYVCQRPL